MTDLGGLGYGVSLGFGINATGEAVGRSYLAQTVPTTGCPPRHTCVTHPADPFSWIAGSMTDLGTLGGTFSEARAVNRNGGHRRRLQQRCVPGAQREDEQSWPGRGVGHR